MTPTEREEKRAQELRQLSKRWESDFEWWWDREGLDFYGEESECVARRAFRMGRFTT